MWYYFIISLYIISHTDDGVSLHTMHYGFQHLVLRVHNIQYCQFSTGRAYIFCLTIYTYMYIFPNNYHIEGNNELLEIKL